MWKQDPDDPFQVGTFVRTRSSGRRARVIAYRGTLGPKGASVYGIMFRRKPFSYTEVLADQLELWQPDQQESRSDLADTTHLNNLSLNEGEDFFEACE